jgi:hypothetical protein
MQEHKNQRGEEETEAAATREESRGRRSSSSSLLGRGSGRTSPSEKQSGTSSSAHATGEKDEEARDSGIAPLPSATIIPLKSEMEETERKQRGGGFQRAPRDVNALLEVVLKSPVYQKMEKKGRAQTLEKAVSIYQQAHKLASITQAGGRHPPPSP